MPIGEQFVALEVPRQHVKAVKTALDSKGLRNRDFKIELKRCDGGKSEEVYVLQTLLEYVDDLPVERRKSQLLEYLDVLGLKDDIGVSSSERPSESSANGATQKQLSLHHIFREYITTITPGALAGADDNLETLLSGVPTSYIKLDTLLLLPSHFWDDEKWRVFLQTCMTEDQYDGMLDYLATAMSVTHIARQSPIPSHNSSATVPNIQRRPHLEPLYGSFGPYITTEPTEQDFNEAFWIGVKQNGIRQVFAPLYTMFSRGNVKEKARLLQLPSITRSPEDGGARGQAAVDMYAGIGYFAFSYAKARIAKVLAFELNAWSVEGFRRGATANGWSYLDAKETDIDEGISGWDRRRLDDPKIKFLLFHADNMNVGRVLEACRHLLPPIRHVNLGLLPDSMQGWRDAVLALDPTEGGWLHVHQNIRQNELTAVTGGVRDEIETFADARWQTQNCVVVTLEHVEKVKSYAPGIIHCVLDIRIEPTFPDRTP